MSTCLPATFDDVRRIALALPGVMERPSYGRPAFYLGKKMLTCLGSRPDHIVLPMNFDEREMRMNAAPDVYFLTDHYRGWPCVLVSLATVEEGTLRYLLERRWRNIAPKRLLGAEKSRSAEAKSGVTLPHKTPDFALLSPGYGYAALSRLAVSAFSFAS